MASERALLIGIACAYKGARDVDALWSAAMEGRAVGAAGDVSVSALVDALADAALADAGLPDDALAHAPVVNTSDSAEARRALDELHGGRHERVVLMDGHGLALLFESARSVEARGGRAYASLAVVAAAADARSAYAAAGVEASSVGVAVLAESASVLGLRRLFGSSDEARFLRPACITRSGEEGGSWLYALALAALSTSNKLVPRASEAAETCAPDLAFFVNQEPRPWVQDPAEGPRRAASHLEGLHVVLEEILEEDRARPVRTGAAWPSELILLSADSAEALARRIEDLSAELETTEDDASLQCLAVDSAHETHGAGTHRLAVVATDANDLCAKLDLARERLQEEAPRFTPRDDIYYGADVSGSPGQVACLFPGLSIPGLQGTYAEHLRDLALHLPVVRAVLDGVDLRDRHPEDPVPTNQLLFPPSTLPEAQRLAFRRRWAIPTLANVCDDPGPSGSNLCHYGVTVANQVGWELLAALRVPVDMLFGQSEGDVAALAAAGALTFEEILHEHAIQRMRPEEIPFDANLAIVNTDGTCLDEVVQAYPGITVAIYLAPHLQLVGGAPDDIKTFVKALRAQNILAQSLPYPAVHTKAFTRIHEIVQAAVDRFHLRLPDRPVYSGITAEPHPEDVEAIRRNIAHNIDRPVHLWRSMKAMYEAGARVFLQLGDGGSMLHRYATRASPELNVVGASMDLDYRNAITQLQAFCAQLWTYGVAVDTSVLYRTRALPEEETASDAAPEDLPSDLPL